MIEKFFSELHGSNRTGRSPRYRGKLILQYLPRNNSDGVHAHWNYGRVTIYGLFVLLDAVLKDQLPNLQRTGGGYSSRIPRSDINTSYTVQRRHWITYSYLSLIDFWSDSIVRVCPPRNWFREIFTAIRSVPNESTVYIIYGPDTDRRESSWRLTWPLVLQLVLPHQYRWRYRNIMCRQLDGLSFFGRRKKKNEKKWESFWRTLNGNFPLTRLQHPWIVRSVRKVTY